MTTLIAPSTVAANIGIDYSSLSAAQQTAFTYQVTSAGSLITTITNCTFTSTTETIRFAADGNGEYQILRNPIITLNSATDVVTGTVLQLSPIPWGATTTYDIGYDGLERLWGMYPFQTIDLNLTWGWTTVPDDIAFVLSELVRVAWNNPYNLSKKRVGDVEVDYATIAAGMTVSSLSKEQREILDSYQDTEQSWHLKTKPNRVDTHDFSDYPNYGVYW